MTRAIPIPDRDRLNARGISGLLEVANKAVENADSSIVLTNARAPGTFSTDSALPGVLTHSSQTSSGLQSSPLATTNLPDVGVEVPYVRKRAGRPRKGEERSVEQKLATKRAGRQRYEERIRAKVNAKKPEDMEWILNYATRKARNSQKQRDKVCLVGPHVHVTKVADALSPSSRSQKKQISKDVLASQAGPSLKAPQQLSLKHATGSTSADADAPLSMPTSSAPPAPLVPGSQGSRKVVTLFNLNASPPASPKNR